MRYKRAFWLWIFFIIVCANKDEVLIEVGDKEFTLQDFKTQYQLGPGDDSTKIMDKVNDFINNKLILIAARDQYYENDPVVKAALEKSKKDIIMRGYYQTQVIDRLKISESKIRKFYDQYTEQYHLAQIVIDNDSLAEFIKTELKKGVPFDSLLKYSLDTLTVNGDIGTFPAMNIPEELLNVLKKTKPGGVAGPIKFGDYIYFLKIIEHTKSTTPKYEEVKENIKNNLLRQEAMEKGQKFIDRIIKQAKIEYNQEGLDILLKPDSLITEKDLETWVVKKYDTSFVKVRTIRDAVRLHYKKSQIEPKILIERELVPDLIYDAAIKAGADKNPKIKIEIEKALDNLIYQKFYSDRVLEKVQIDTQTVHNYYMAHKSDYPDKKFPDVYTLVYARVRELKVDSLRKILFDELRNKYNPKINNEALAKLMTKRTSVILILMIVIAFFVCSKKEEDVLIRVDGSTLTLEKFKKYIPETEYKNLSDEMIKELFDNWINQEVLYLEAKKKGIDKQDSIALLLEQYAKNLLAMALVREEFGTTTVSEQQILQYFTEHQDEFLYAVKLAQIVLPNYESAVTTLAEIKAGADFSKIAKERSLARAEDPTNARVITDYLPRGKLGDFATEEIIFKMKPGDISEPIPYIQGTYLIVKMLDKKKILSKAELTNELRAQIHNYLLSRAYQEFVERFVDSLRSVYKITTDLSPLRK